MSDGSSIGWTDATWNPWTGCEKVSPGCDHCYAETAAERWRGQKAFPAGFDLTLRRYKLYEPIGWKCPRRVFTHSMSDPFLGAVPIDVFLEFWEVMLLADRHIFQVLTKRPGRARWVIDHYKLPLPPHIWLGVSVENQEMADFRIPVLQDIPTSQRFLSCEPLLGPLDLTPYLATGDIRWIIDGGESGPGRRGGDSDWFRSIRDACQTHGVPYFHKQGFAFRPGQDRLLDGDTWDQAPEEMMAVAWRAADSRKGQGEA